MTPEDKSKIDELKKSLYSRNAPDIRMKRHLHFERENVDNVKTDWEHPDEQLTINARLNQNKDNSMSFFTKLLIGSIIFFILAMGIGAYLVFNGANIISANNIDININGPITVAGGDPIDFGVQVNNKNNVRLQSVDIEVDFPVGTVDPIERSKELKQINDTMDDVVPGGVGQKSFKAVIYGEENSKKEILITILYRIKGSNAVFKKQKSYEILISSSPLSLAVSSFKEITSGQEMEFKVTLTSNSEEIIRNLLLRASYPFGFTVSSSDVKSDGNIAVWKIGDIPPKGKKTITFKGKLEGQDDETRTFHFTAGAQSVKNTDVIGTEYITVAQDVSIRKPFITTAISFDDDTGNKDNIGRFNTPIRATISWFNNLPTTINDGEIHVKIVGTAFDKVSVQPGEGLYRSIDNEIVWNRLTNSDLGSIGAGESGKVIFSFTPRNFTTPLKTITNPKISFDVSIQGKRTSESNVPETITSSVKRSVIISSNLALSSSILRSGVLENIGPIPPRADKTTTYTVSWIVDNTSSTITGAEVRALLPAYVKWTGKISPSGEDISYDANKGEVVWRVGNVDSYTTNSGRRRQVSFQIALTPSLSQVGQAPLLVQDTTLVGHDDFTGEVLTSTRPALSTRFSTDATFRDGNDMVAP